MRKSRAPSRMLAAAPLGVVYAAPNVHAHLSAFSSPKESNQAFRSGSVTVSSSSWAKTEAIPSAPALPFGLSDCFWHALGHRSPLPTNEYLISLSPMRPLVCQPQ